ncbi:unnamed protein product [Parnassius mnemosyne]|uniref:PiggyBac transposable element-derived protein domain-containing protein n=2 Tax=Parnassius mnemosyne TaxID=213953 RepID=A0AAV1M070_9NEOP
MAEHARVSTSYKAGTRAQRILALVPKPGASSDIESSDSSDGEITGHASDNDESSIPPSLPSSLENLHVLSESENDYREVLVPAENTTNVTRRVSLFSNFSTSSVSASPTNVIVPATPSPISSMANSSTYILSVPSPSNATRSSKRVYLVKKTIVKKKKLEVKWTTARFKYSAEISDKIFNKSSETKSPLEYFKQFFSEDIFELIVRESNLYHMQIKGTPMNMTLDEAKDFIAINIIMGVVRLPAYTDYWSKALRYSKIADIMTLKRFQLFRRYLHFADALGDDGDRYYKIRPLLEKIRQNCINIEEEHRFSVDEMTVPYKGTRAGTRKQYIKNKPRKWGFKIFVRAGISGMVYDFLLYGGEDTFRFHQFNAEENSMGLGAKVVIALSKTIKEPACKVIYFDNFFTSIELVYHLRNEYGIFSLGTVRPNRLRGGDKKLPSDNILKKRGRGAFSQITSNERKVAVVKWFDNKCFTIASSYADAHPVDHVLRYNKDKKRKEPVPCPNIVRQYNAHMGGVDLADMLIALYRTEMRAHRWYIPLFSQMLDICINNAWLMYRRETKCPKPIKLKEFRCAIADSLTTVDRVVHSKNTEAKKFVTPENQMDMRYDQMGHMPSFTSKGRCKLCVKGQTKFICNKCQVRLCLVEDRNCFYYYHQK